MAGCCNDDHLLRLRRPALNSPGWRRALWIALAINAGMFLAEIAAGVAAGSASLQADALDFLGDAANYAISLGVAGMALTWRARAALLKGASWRVRHCGCSAARPGTPTPARCRRPRSWVSSAWPHSSPMAASR